MRILLTGGTGFIGKAVLQEFLQKGNSVVLLTRSGTAPLAHDHLKVLSWDGENQGKWSTEVANTDAVVNLAGEPITAKRWSAAQKKIILQSRVNATRAIVEAIRNAERKPSVLVSASAVGYYGNVPDGGVDENYPKGEGFLAEVCALWEEAAKKAQSFGTRVVLLRIGIVTEKGGGALGKMAGPFQFFLGGPLGSGKQWFPWVHRRDIINIISFAITEDSLQGPVNGVAPDPVTMEQFCSALGNAMKRPSWAPVPAFILKRMLGEMSGMLLEGQKAIPAKLERAGYRFVYPNLKPALSSIFEK